MKLLRFRNLSIRRKLAALLFLSMGVVLLLSNGAFITLEIKGVENELERKLVSLADLLASQSNAALTFSEPISANEVLSVLKIEPSIKAAFIYDLKGKIFASYLATPPPSEAERKQYQRLADGILRRPSRTSLLIESGRAHQFRPVRLDNTELGFIHLVDDMRILHKKLAEHLKVSAIIVGTAVLIAVLLSIRLPRLISGPLLELTGLMRQVSRTRDYKIRGVKHSEDETGALVDGFNAMLYEIEQRDRTLAHYNENLEQEVAARTRELQTAMQAQAEERDRAQAANRAKSQFLATMSHEIRTPMHGVLGTLELLQLSGLNERQRHFAEISQNSAESLLTIINDILDFSKIEAGKMELEHLELDLRELLETSCTLLSERASRKGLELLCRIPPQLHLAYTGDPSRLRQVLINLLSNAIKFTEQGEILVSVELLAEETDSSHLRFSVEDQGIGISEEMQRDIFSAFSQADGSTTRQYGGTGLGLAISRQLVELMGGRIGVDSIPGESSTFWFTLHLPKRPAEKTEEIADLSGLRVLVIDDNATSREILHQQLDAWHMSCEEAIDAPQALNKLWEAQSREMLYDLVIIDRHMSEMDTPALARVIDAEPRMQGIRVVMLSSVMRAEESDQYQTVGVHGFLTKPVLPSQLYRCLCKVMQKNDASGPSASIPPASGQGEIVQKASVTPRDFRVLLAEDNPVNREVALSLLEELGCEVDMVEDGEQALQAVQAKNYQLILMDCHMPKLDGFEATDLIRKHEAETDCRRVPVIALTADVIAGVQEKCRAAGMDDYLSKPYNQEQLAQVMQRWLPIELPSPAPPVVDKAAPSPSENAPRLDLSKLEKIRARKKGGVKRVNKLIELYFEHSAQLMTQLRAARDNGDLAAAGDLAHSLKSSSANVGAMCLAALCKQLELAAKQGEEQSPVELLPALEKEYEEVIVALKTTAFS